MIFQLGDKLYDQENDVVYIVDMVQNGEMYLKSINLDHTQTFRASQEDPDGLIEYTEEEQQEGFSGEWFLPQQKQPMSENEIRLHLFEMMFDSTKKSKSLSARVEEAVALTNVILKEVFNEK